MPHLSRRKLVAILSSAPLLAQGDFEAASKADPVLVLCAHYGELLRRRAALMHAWGDHEAWLGDYRNWFRLSIEERRSVPEGQILWDIDEQIDQCIGEGAQVMRRLRTVHARTIVGATAKLSVVAEFIEPDDYPSAHKVLLSAIADLRAIEGAR